MKHAQLWISTVLYVALGIVTITIVLSAGIPLVNKIRDRNVIAQTKNLMVSVDENIKIVSNEGPGSKRFISPINIDRGNLVFDDINNKLLWSMKTGSKIMEPGAIFKEGVLTLTLNETNIEDEYLVNIETSNGNVADLNLVSDYQNPFSGSYSLTIEHTGTYNDGVPILNIRVN